MDVNEKLRVALLRILNSNGLRLFGCLIYNFDIEMIKTEDVTWNWKESGVPKEIIESFEDTLTASVTIIKGVPKMIIFTKFAEEKTIEEIIFILIHEIMHILGGDCVRKGDRNRNIFNLAGDHVINKSLIEDIKNGNLTKIKQPKEAFIIDSLMNKNFTKEEVYDILNNKAKIKKYGVGSFPVALPGNSESNGNQSGEMQINVQMLEVEIDGKKYKFPVDATIAPGNSGDNKTNDTTESLKAEARAVMNNDNIVEKGSSSGSVAALIKKMIEVEIPWTTLLDRAICSKIVPDPDNRSWRFLQKRMYTHGFTIPGTSDDEKPATLIIGEDQSGSINDKDIKKFASVVMQSIKYFDEVRVIKHDIKIHSDETIDIQSMTIEKVLFETLGRGGTSHKHVFQAIEDSYNLENIDISLVLLLTDFESDIEQIWNKYEWTKDIPVSVVLTRNNKVPSYVDSKPILIKSKKD